MSSAVTIRPFEPVYYHREYKNDIPQKTEESYQDSWINQCQRSAFVALPFISLYKPLSFPLSLAMGGLRTFTCINQLLASIKNGNSEKIPYAMLQTTIAAIALAGTVFAHPLGMLISTGHDLIIETVHLIDNLHKGEYQKAMENCLNIINNALYLALFLHGGLEIAIASLAMQILIGLYHSQAEFSKGNYIEAVGHLGMALVRGNQLAGQAQMLQLKWKIEDILRKAKSQESKRGVRSVHNLEVKAGLKKQNALLLGHSKTSNNRLSESSDDLKNTGIDLRSASRSEADKIAELILKYTDPRNGGPVIYNAAKANDLDAVKMLMKYGGSATDAFHGALSGKSMPILRYLIEEVRMSPSVINADKSWHIYWNKGWWEGLDYLLNIGVHVQN